jgi:hypothetical protein
MVENESSLALSFPFCQFTILHNLIAVLSSCIIAGEVDGKQSFAADIQGPVYYYL